MNSTRTDSDELYNLYKDRDWWTLQRDSNEPYNRDRAMNSITESDELYNKDREWWTLHGQRAMHSSPLCTTRAVLHACMLGS